VENQHRHIPGYRDFDEGTAGIIAGLKGFFNKELQERIDMVKAAHAHQLTAINSRMIQVSDAIQDCEKGDQTPSPELVDELESLRADRDRVYEAGRWLSMARTDFQNGAMKLIRAVAQPLTEF
jgi:hypothetical protein